MTNLIGKCPACQLVGAEPADWERLCKLASHFGRFLWGNPKTGRISVRLPNGRVRVVQT